MGLASQAGAQSLDYNVQQPTEDREKPSKVYIKPIKYISYNLFCCSVTKI